MFKCIGHDSLVKILNNAVIDGIHIVLQVLCETSVLAHHRLSAQLTDNLDDAGVLAESDVCHYSFYQTTQA